MRLRTWLDANQRDREQMSRSVLALDPHFSDVRPRHPSGGPDGGRDIEALFDGERVAYGAVGFQNGANDSDEQRRQVRRKFSSDLRSALSAKSDLSVFVFITNLHLAMGEQSEMKEEVHKAGIKHCEIIDRERLRIELDSPAGFFIRFQHLGMPLSEAEQASFLARYGDRIQQVVSTGFQRIERTLNRILFLQEASDILEGVHVRLNLRRSYSADEIGHFRAFVDIYLRALKHEIFAIWFGVSDKPGRFRMHLSQVGRDEQPGIKHGIAMGQWERHVTRPFGDPAQEELTAVMEPTEHEQDKDGDRDMVQVGDGNAVGMDPVSVIFVSYSHDDPLIRFRPRLELRDLDDCSFMPILNRSLAEKLGSIEVFANGYKLAYIGPEDFKIDDLDFELRVPDAFTPEELADPWVRIRPSELASSFHLRFTSMTPRRMFEHGEAPDSRPGKA